MNDYGIDGGQIHFLVKIYSLAIKSNIHEDSSKIF